MGAFLSNVPPPPASKLADLVVAAARADSVNAARALLRRLCRSSQFGPLVVAADDAGVSRVFPLAGLIEQGKDPDTSVFYAWGDDSVDGAMSPPIRVLPEWFTDFADADVPGITAFSQIIEESALARIPSRCQPPPARGGTSSTLPPSRWRISACADAR